MAELRTLEQLTPGMQILVAGNQVWTVSPELAAAFAPGDSLGVVPETGALLHIPARERALATEAVDRAHAAFRTMKEADDGKIAAFYEAFAARLEDEAVWAQVQAVNEQDVAEAERRGRSTTRLLATQKLRAGMIEGLRGWIEQPSRRGQVLERVDHGAWSVELVGDALGVVAFIFEGRPNVLADATGVLRGGNTVVFRIGSDALGTARALMALAVKPALAEAGLPADAVCLVDSSAHAAGWALFSDSRLALAVARGSGTAVATLGGLAHQHGIPVSLHGTGGAWMVAAEDALPQMLEDAVYHSLDRKVCNTLNTCCIPRPQQHRLIPALLSGLERAGERLGYNYKLHVVEADRDAVPAALYERQVQVRRAGGSGLEAQAQTIDVGRLGHEWEWEQTPEVTLVLVESVDEAIALFNRYSPRFVATLISDDPALHRHFFECVDAPFVGDGFTRWVDGQKALDKPELGLTNWERGRLMGRAGVLSGDTVFTIRTRAVRTRFAAE